MSFNREIQGKINRFAKEQSQNYLQDVEMTYMERILSTAMAAFSLRCSRGQDTVLVL